MNLSTRWSNAIISIFILVDVNFMQINSLLYEINHFTIATISENNPILLSRFLKRIVYNIIIIQIGYE